MTAAADRKPSALTKGEVYRQARIWHGYLSAFAFLALLFFSATGILLNHPNWLKVELPPVAESQITLTPQELATLQAAPDQPRQLVKLVGGKARLLGAFRNGEAAGPQVFVRMQGVRGSSDLVADLATGEVRVTVEPQHPIAVLNGLHRGEQASAPWRAIIDIAGGVLIVMALIGYVLFFSLRFRLRTALVLTGASLAAMVGVFALLVR